MSIHRLGFYQSTNWTTGALHFKVRNASRREINMQLIIAAAIVYLPFVFLVTARGNVPMNEKLDKMAPDSEDAAVYWKTYGPVWTRWNTVRTIGSIATAGCYLLAAVWV